MSAPAAYQVDNDRVPEVFRDFFDNSDWTIHKFVVYGSYAFFLVAVLAHVAVWAWKPWGQ